MKMRNTLIGFGIAAALAAAVGTYSVTASAHDTDYGWGMMGGYGPGYNQGNGYGPMPGYGPGYGHMRGYARGNGQRYAPGYHMRGWGGGYGLGAMHGYGYGHGMMGW